MDLVFDLCFVPDLEGRFWLETVLAVIAVQRGGVRLQFALVDREGAHALSVVGNAGFRLSILKLLDLRLHVLVDETFELQRSC